MRHVHRTQAIAIAGAAALFAGSASAQTVSDWPSKPVAVVVPFTPGSVADLETRLYAEKLGSNLGKNFIVDNRAGAGAMIGVAYVVKAAPDGYTLLTATSALTIAPLIYPTLGFDPIKDLAYVAMMSKRAPMLIANLKFPPNNGAEYIAYAKANPGKINLGVTAQAGVNHLMVTWMNTLSNSKVTYVAYKGEGPMLPDLLSGRLDAAAIGVGTAIRLAKAGKVRALGSSLTTRSKAWPELPTIAEQGNPQFSYTSWLGVGAPSGTPLAVVNKLSENFAKTARSAEVTGTLEPDGWVMVGSTPAQFRQLIVTETERWKKVVQDNGIVAE